MLRENHSGMETNISYFHRTHRTIRCVRTIVVWKPSPAALSALIAFALRENHSGMETFLLALLAGESFVA